MSLIIYLKKLNIEGGHIDPKGKRGIKLLLSGSCAAASSQMFFTSGFSQYPYEGGDHKVNEHHKKATIEHELPS